MSDGRLNATINSYHYIQNQWDDIKKNVHVKRSLVHNLAEQQKYSLNRIQSHNHNNIIIDNGNYPTRNEHSKAIKQIEKVSPTILRGM